MTTYFIPFNVSASCESLDQSFVSTREDLIVSNK
jgi:hypothetical protein